MGGSHDHEAGGGSGNHAGHSHGSQRDLQRRALLIALVANGGFLVAEIVGGLAFNSLALLADAAHMTSDVVGLVVALVAQQLLVRPATARHSFGFQRAEVLGAQFNGLLLLASAGWITFEAVGRIGDPVEVQGGGMLVVAALGLAVNVGSAVLLARARGRSLNMHGAFVHMAVDAAGSVAAMVAALAILLAGADWVDAAMSIAIAALVVWSAWGLLRDTTNVLLEAAPNDVSLEDVEASLCEAPGVEAVHHLHIWSIASDVTALSAHVVLRDVESLHDAQEEGSGLKAMLAERFGIDHATLELECHPCGPGEHVEHAH